VGDLIESREAFLEQVRDLYASHPEWSVIDVTGRAVEENAAIIAELMPGLRFQALGLRA
jgi:regulator of PEP synthase PpsR (kinase-PPPase family)